MYFCVQSYFYVSYFQEKNDRSVSSIPPPVLPIATNGQPTSNGNITTSNGQQTRENGVSAFVEPTPCPDLILPDTKSNTVESESQKLEGDEVVTQNCEDSGVATLQATDCSHDTSCELSTEQSSLDSTSSSTEEKPQLERDEESLIPSTVEGTSEVVVEQSAQPSSEEIQPATDASLTGEQVTTESDPSTTKSVVSSQSEQLTSEAENTQVTALEQQIAVESVTESEPIVSVEHVEVAVQQQETTEIVAAELQNATEHIAATVNPISTVEAVPMSKPIAAVEPIPEPTIKAVQDEAAAVQQQQHEQETVTPEQPDVQLNAVLAQHFACILYLQKLKDTGHQLTAEQDNYLGQMSAYESQLRTFQSNQETSATEELQVESEPTVEVSNQEPDNNLQESAESAATAPELPEGLETTADSSVKESEAENDLVVTKPEPMRSESEQDSSTVQSESSIELSDTHRLSTTDSLEPISLARHSQESFSMVASTESLQHVKPEEAAKSEDSLQIVSSISADSSQMGSDLAVPDCVAEAIADESPALLEPEIEEEEVESALEEENEGEDVVGDIPTDVEGSLAAATEDSDPLQVQLG